MAEAPRRFRGGNGIKSATGWRYQMILCQRKMRTCSIKEKGRPDDILFGILEEQEKGQPSFSLHVQGFPRYNGDYTSGGVLKKVAFLICTAITPSYDSCVE